MTATPRNVIFSALTRDAGFRRWATMVYQPKTAAAERLVRTIRNDPRFPEGLDDRERFMFWLRHGPRLPYHVRREAGPMWAGYARWRRARTAREAQARPASEPAHERTDDGTDAAVLRLRPPAPRAHGS